MPQEVVSVQIYDRTYRFSCEDQDPGYIERAAGYLDGKMHKLAAVLGHRSPLDIALMAAMEIAEEVLSARRRREELLDEADQRIRRFTRLLEDESDSLSPPSR